ncbi:hypothetical protein KC19_6G117600 [Ceratodon purpureus]|uniref:Secreted protein n=1 Tax=Ceratodon purpureus TaxID=3225 RepID=A0A8T0HHE1_CERPU|nr:hypothetical protein KC19_6G117600 [Ceratodon purpureus]
MTLKLLYQLCWHLLCFVLQHELQLCASELYDFVIMDVCLATSSSLFTEELFLHLALLLVNSLRCVFLQVTHV